MFRRLLLWTAVAASAWAQARPVDVESFDKVWTTIRDTHWQKQPAGLDWDAIRAEYRPQVEAASNPDEARAVMQKMIGRLKQTHFAILPGSVYSSLDTSDVSAEPEGSATPGLQLRVLEGLAVVTEVEPDSPAAQAGVRAGWVVQKIDDRELKPLIERATANPNVHELQLTRSLEGLLTGQSGSTLDVTFLDGKDQATTLRLKRAEPRGFWREFGNLPPSHVFFEDRRIGQTAYIRFNLFLDIPHVMPGFERTISSCMPCEGVIIDLRGNPGGIGGMAMGLAGFLVNQPNQKLGTMYMRDTTLNFVVNPRPGSFTGPVAILIDGTSASTSEIFAGGLQDLGRARVFGTKSAAAALPSVFTRLPNGDGFQYAIANYISRNGQALEGNGVTPDQEVHLTRDTLLAGRDAVIDAALYWIRSNGDKK
jgi:carboxyl-terminal processing protease